MEVAPTGGRPRIDAELRVLIRRMGVENPLWGVPRIHGELLKLGFEVAQSSVAKYMFKRQRPPSQGWRTFLRNHAPDIAAMDLFVVPTIGFELLYAFDRRILDLACTPISGALLNISGAGLDGWQWLFILEALPSILVAFGVVFYLIATWLANDERGSLEGRLESERQHKVAVEHVGILKALTDLRVLACAFHLRAM